MRTPRKKAGPYFHVEYAYDAYEGGASGTMRFHHRSDAEDVVKKLRKEGADAYVLPRIRIRRKNR